MNSTPPPPADLDQVKSDLRLIRNLLTVGDSKFPFTWSLLPTMGGLIAVAMLLYYFIPGWKEQTADQLVITFWLPVIASLFAVGFAFYLVRLRKAGRIVLIGPLRDLFFARYFIGPVLFFFVWILRNDQQSAALTLMAFAALQGMTSFVLPKAFRVLPTATLTIAIVEYLLKANGPEVILFNGLFTALAFVYAGLTVRHEQKSTANRQEPPQ